MLQHLNLRLKLQSENLCSLFRFASLFFNLFFLNNFLFAFLFLRLNIISFWLYPRYFLQLLNGHRQKYSENLLWRQLHLLSSFLDFEPMFFHRLSHLILQIFSFLVSLFLDRSYILQQIVMNCLLDKIRTRQNQRIASFKKATCAKNH